MVGHGPGTIPKVKAILLLSEQPHQHHSATDREEWDQLGVGNSLQEQCWAMARHRPATQTAA